eukprot:4524068-Ditylum_brightwellii.AAC.1
MVRYMNAAHAAAYVGLNDTYTSQNFFAHLNAKYRWLSTAEMERIVHECAWITMDLSCVTK